MVRGVWHGISLLTLNGTHDFFGHLETSEDLLKKVGPKARRFYVLNEDHGLNETI